MEHAGFSSSAADPGSVIESPETAAPSDGWIARKLYETIRSDACRIEDLLRAEGSSNYLGGVINAVSGLGRSLGARFEDIEARYLMDSWRSLAAELEYLKRQEEKEVLLPADILNKLKELVGNASELADAFPLADKTADASSNLSESMAVAGVSIKAVRAELERQEVGSYNLEQRAIRAILKMKTPVVPSPAEIRAVLACLKQPPSILEKSANSGVESNDLRSFWRYFFIGFSGPAALTQSFVDLKPLEPGESLRLAWASTLTRLANAAKRI